MLPFSENCPVMRLVIFHETWPYISSINLMVEVKRLEIDSGHSIYVIERKLDCLKPKIEKNSRNFEFEIYVGNDP